MRAMIILALLVFSGCSAMDSILGPPAGRASSSGGALKRDWNKIYVGSEEVIIDAPQADRYECERGPLYCESFGSKMICQCPI